MLILEFLAVGTWAFWLVLAVVAIAMSEMLDNDRPGYATFIAVAAFAALAVLGDLNPFKWIYLHPMQTAEYVVGYFAVGTLWGVAKWFFWLRKMRRFMEEFSVQYPNFDHSTWREAMRRRAWPMELPPRVGEHKSKILGWMMLWPSSMIWTLLHDPVKWLFEEIYANLGGMMQGISNRVFKGFVVPGK
jgi:hypothetical protein